MPHASRGTRVSPRSRRSPSRIFRFSASSRFVTHWRISAFTTRRGALLFLGSGGAAAPPAPPPIPAYIFSVASLPRPPAENTRGFGSVAFFAYLRPDQTLGAVSSLMPSRARVTFRGLSMPRLAPRMRGGFAAARTCARREPAALAAGNAHLSPVPPTRLPPAYRSSLFHAAFLTYLLSHLFPLPHLP